MLIAFSSIESIYVNQSLIIGAGTQKIFHDHPDISVCCSIDYTTWNSNRADTNNPFTREIYKSSKILR